MAATIDQNQVPRTTKSPIFEISGLRTDRVATSVKRSFDTAIRLRPVIMVCWSDSDRLHNELLQKALRDTEAMDAVCYVVNVEVPTLHFGKSIAERRRSRTSQLRLATSSGARIVFLKAHDVARALLDFAWDRGANRIIIGRSRRGILHRLLWPSVTKVVLKRARDIEVQVVGYERKITSPSQRKGASTRSQLNACALSKGGMFPVA
jgi:K+-sensing histidine kinase KdpD